MCFYSPKSNILRAWHRRAGNSPFAGESRGHPECACSKRCQPTEIVFGTIKLLRQVHAEYVKGSQASVRFKASWLWTAACEEAFQESKKLLLESQWLVHYDPRKPLKLATDASAYGLGAVISHILEDGSERPIAFASRTLSSSEKNYSQLHKEALAIIFGVKKFHQYLYGCKFTLETDHQPLVNSVGRLSYLPISMKLGIVVQLDMPMPTSYPACR